MDIESLKIDMMRLMIYNGNKCIFLYLSQVRFYTIIGPIPPAILRVRSAGLRRSDRISW